jgi:hypothetical protein
MEDRKAAALLQEVKEKTRAHRIDWEPTAKEDVFVAAIGGKFTLTISSHAYLAPGVDDVSPELLLKDAEGREFLRVLASTNEIARELQELLDNVRQQALPVEEKVDDLLTELRKL